MGLLKYILNYIKFFCRFINYSAYMKNGIYGASENCSCVSLNKKNNLTLYVDTLTEKNIFIKIIMVIVSKVLSFKKIEIKSDNKYFQGDLAFFNTNDDVIKIIDNRRNLVLSIYKNIKKCEQIYSRYTVVQNYFNIPKIYSANIDKKIIIEQQIKTVPIIKYTMLSHIIDIEVKYLINQKPVIKSLKISKKNYIAQYIINKYDIDISKKYKFYYLHGDMWKSNVLFDGQQIHVIDWEYYDLYPFFYDCVFFILNEYIIDNKINLISSYLLGDFDQKLIKLFNQVGESYIIEKKKEYLLISIIQQSEVRWV